MQACRGARPEFDEGAPVRAREHRHAGDAASRHDEAASSPWRRDEADKVPRRRDQGDKAPARRAEAGQAAWRRSGADNASWRRDDGGNTALTMAVILLGIAAALGGSYLLLRSVADLKDTGDRAEGAAARAPQAFRLEQATAERQVGLLVRVRQLIVLPEGSAPIDLSSIQLHIDAAAPHGTITFHYSPTAGPGLFTVTPLRDGDGSLAPQHPLLGRGDLAELILDFSGSPLPGLRLEQVQNAGGAEIGRVVLDQQPSALLAATSSYDITG